MLKNLKLHRKKIIQIIILDSKILVQLRVKRLVRLKIFKIFSSTRFVFNISVFVIINQSVTIYSQHQRRVVTVDVRSDALQAFGVKILKDSRAIIQNRIIQRKIAAGAAAAWLMARRDRWSPLGYVPHVWLKLRSGYLLCACVAAASGSPYTCSVLGKKRVLHDDTF